MRLSSVLICDLLIGTLASQAAAAAKVNDDDETGTRNKSGKLLSLFNFVSFPVSDSQSQCAELMNKGGEPAP